MRKFIEKIQMSYTQAGLILNILGVCFLFIYGLPSRIIDPYEENILSVGPLQRKEIEKRKKENRRINIFAYVGLILVFLGFILQFLGTFL